MSNTAVDRARMTSDYMSLEAQGAIRRIYEVAVQEIRQLQAEHKAELARIARAARRARAAA